MKAAATVILFHPEIAIVDNIKSYINAIETLYVIDNSGTINQSLIDEINSLDSKIIYIRNDKNTGIGHALNTGARHAVSDGYNWLLTMDQDSRFDNIDIFFRCCKKHEDDMNIAVFSPSIDRIDTEPCVHATPKVVITSGNLIRLSHFQSAGGFESKLFIDEIDHDFCLKLGELNLKILQFKGVYLQHSLGEPEVLRSLFLRRKKTRNIHSYQRVYYQTRNRLYMAKRHSKNYPEAFSLRKVIYKVIYKKGIRIIQWEPDKIRKLRAIYHGVIDYLNDNYGPYDIRRNR